MIFPQNSSSNWYDDVSLSINRYVAPVVLCFGIVGNTLNIFLLSQRTLRTNSCAWLFLISSISNSVCIVFGMITRIGDGWNIDFTKTNRLLCQLRVFLVFSSRTIGFWLIALATIDRWLLSSIDANYRKKSSLKNAQKGVIIVTCTSIILYAQVFYCYDANLLTAPLQCYSRTMECRLVNDLTYILMTILIPLTTTLVFGLMTISNVRQSQRRIRHLAVQNLPHTLTLSSADNPQNRLKKKTDRHMRQVLFVQVIILTILAFPQAIQKIYTTAAEYRYLDTYSDNRSFDTLIYNCSVTLSFLASGMPFYIYTLCGGDIFRNALSELFQTVKTKIARLIE
ncbi:unnamed protein product [Adineta ricciae]|uniref:G-protein coupled receptors family 1 profile domain-containing protein n=1 Tax=Adineta ricciae TaxID=249248 RepID=A0A814EBS4_ADIRI|nr:unnamed protein product [Adineta ricciae]